MVSRRTGIWRVGYSSPHFRFGPGTAPAFGGALARDDGSDLLSLKLLFFCRRATSFSIPPVFRRLCQLCPVGFPPRLARPFALLPSNGEIFRRGCPARARSPCWFAVATQTLLSVRSLRFLRRTKLSADSHSAKQRFLIATRRGIPDSHRRTSATRRGGIREHCPARHAVTDAPRREPGTPTAPSLSPV